jgi:hypothetical protein
MSAVIQRAVALLALIATFLTSSAGVAAPANTTPADKCLAAPNTAAPPGHHWHYRTDRATQRKCWYVRAPGEPGQQTTAPAKKGAAKSVRSRPAQSGPPPATETGPTPVSTAEVARLPPQIESPRLRPQSAPCRTILRHRFKPQLFQPAQASSHVIRRQALRLQVARRRRILHRHQFRTPPLRRKGRW